MRSMYESEEDLQRETDVITMVESAWKCKAVKLSIKYQLDYVLTRHDQAVAFCEIKTRNYSMEQIDKFGGYLLSLGKWMAAIQITNVTDIPFFLVVKASDGVYYAEFRPPFKIYDDLLVRGRKDRDDWQDIEPCVLLNVRRFKPLGVKNGTKLS